ncbi:hypothetical protein THAOC_16770, partial [Thalassiosira oceanica]
APHSHQFTQGHFLRKIVWTKTSSYGDEGDDGAEQRGAARRPAAVRIRRLLPRRPPEEPCPAGAEEEVGRVRPFAPHRRGGAPSAPVRAGHGQGRRGVAEVQPVEPLLVGRGGGRPVPAGVRGHARASPLEARPHQPAERAVPREPRDDRVRRGPVQPAPPVPPGRRERRPRQRLLVRLPPQPVAPRPVRGAPPGLLGVRRRAPAAAGHRPPHRARGVHGEPEARAALRDRQPDERLHRLPPHGLLRGVSRQDAQGGRPHAPHGARRPLRRHGGAVRPGADREGEAGGPQRDDHGQHHRVPRGVPDPQHAPPGEQAREALPHREGEPHPELEAGRRQDVAQDALPSRQRPPLRRGRPRPGNGAEDRAGQVRAPHGGEAGGRDKDPRAQAGGVRPRRRHGRGDDEAGPVLALPPRPPRLLRRRGCQGRPRRGRGVGSDDHQRLEGPRSHLGLRHTPPAAVRHGRQGPAPEGGGGGAREADTASHLQARAAPELLLPPLREAAGRADRRHGVVPAQPGQADMPRGPADPT